MNVVILCSVNAVVNKNILVDDKHLYFSAHGSDGVQCIYLPEGNRVVYCDESCIGVRSDLKGMLLLDTALQPPVNKKEEKVKVEIPLAEVRN